MNCKTCKTVLGEIRFDSLGITLPHEHICCYSEYAYKMAGAAYLDKEVLARAAVSRLKDVKETCGLSTFVDCTPVNIGRDLELLKRVSEQSGVNIVCSTGFYHTDEVVLHATSEDTLCSYMVADAKSVNAGIIKCAVEEKEMSPFDEKLLRASAKAHLQLGLPVVMHTNAKNQNATWALEILLSEGVKPNAITVGHLSDTADVDFVAKIASYGCFIGLDRLYGSTSEEYISSKLAVIRTLCDAGYEDRILLAHDDLFFNGFAKEPRINATPRFSCCFDNILPRLSRSLTEKLMVQNPARMLMA